MANLFVHEYPNLPLTTAQVLTAYNGGVGETDTSAITFMETTGFDGKTATVTRIYSRPSIIYAANHGGVWATISAVGTMNYYPDETHAVAITSANEQGPSVVNSTQPYPILTWYWWSYFAMARRGIIPPIGNLIQYWWVRWNKSASVTARV